MWTIGQVARRFGVSRSTLLYYDSVGLLAPSGRTRANYRLYSDRDLRRMELIRVYREAGLSLTAIAGILDSGKNAVTPALEKRLGQINAEIHSLRDQQRIIVELLKNRGALRKCRAMDKQRWMDLLRATGLDDDEMFRWHAEFERMSPEAHQDFLEALGIVPQEIRRIRKESRARSVTDG